MSGAGGMRRGWLALVLLVVPSPSSGQGQEPRGPIARYRVPVGDSWTLGPADALVTIVMFSSLACPHSQRGLEIVTDLRRAYPRQVRVVYKHLPLEAQQHALQAARAAEAAGAQGRFWPYVEAALNHQPALRPADLERYARDLGLGIDSFRAALGGKSTNARVEADRLQAEELGLIGSPTFFLNGRYLLGSADGIDVFRAVVDAEIEEVRGRLDRGADPAAIYEALTAGGERRIPTATESKPAPTPTDVELRLEDLNVGHSVGPKDARVTVAAWTAVGCPECAALARAIKTIRQLRGDAVRVVLLHRPPRVPEWRALWLAAEGLEAAAEQGRFWKYFGALAQSETPPQRGALERIAEEVGLEMQAWRSAVDARRHRPTVGRHVEEATRLGVRTTPAVFVNGRLVPGGGDAVALETNLKALVEEAVAGLPPARELASRP